MTAVDTNQYDYEAFIAERAVRHNEQRQAARAEAERPFTEYDGYLEALKDADDRAEQAYDDALLEERYADDESLAASEPPMDAEEVEVEEKRQPWAETVANIRNYPEAWRPFVRRPQVGDRGAAS